MPEMSSFNLLSSFLSFALVIGLLLVTLFFFKKIGPSWITREGKNIKVVESLDLGGKYRVVIVSVCGEKLLLGLGQNQICLLCRLTEDNVDTENPKIDN